MAFAYHNEGNIEDALDTIATHFGLTISHAIVVNLLAN